MPDNDLSGEKDVKLLWCRRGSRSCWWNHLKRTTWVRFPCPVPVIQHSISNVQEPSEQRRIGRDRLPNPCEQWKLGGSRVRLTDHHLFWDPRLSRYTNRSSEADTGIFMAGRGQHQFNKDISGGRWSDSTPKSDEVKSG